MTPLGERLSRHGPKSQEPQCIPNVYVGNTIYSLCASCYDDDSLRICKIDMPLADFAHKRHCKEHLAADCRSFLQGTACDAATTHARRLCCCPII
jgi:hypothetical protein